VSIFVVGQVGRAAARHMSGDAAAGEDLESILAWSEPEVPQGAIDVRWNGARDPEGRSDRALEVLVECTLEETRLSASPDPIHGDKVESRRRYPVVQQQGPAREADRETSEAEHQRLLVSEESIGKLCRPRVGHGEPGRGRWRSLKNPCLPALPPPVQPAE
jgi:hypothetical protein